MPKALTIDRRQMQTEQAKADAALLHAARKALHYFDCVTRGRSDLLGDHDDILIGRELQTAIAWVEATHAEIR